MDSKKSKYLKYYPKEFWGSDNPFFSVKDGFIYYGNQKYLNLRGVGGYFDETFFYVRRVSLLSETYSNFVSDLRKDLGFNFFINDVFRFSFFGKTGKQLKKYFLKAVFESMRGISHKTMMKLLYERKKLKLENIKKILDVKDKIIQLEKDNLVHLAPLVVHYGMDPKGLKETFGKGLWKKLSKNTFHRNSLFLNIPITSLNNFVDTPSSLLKIYKRANSRWGSSMFDYIEEKEIYDWLKKNTRGKWFDFEYIYKTLILLRDFKDNYPDERINIQKLSSVEELEKKHNELVQLRYKLIEEKRNKLNFETFWWYDAAKIKVYEKDNYKATLLKNGNELLDEGRAMNHCVGSYTNVCSSKNNITMIFSITKDTLQYSTLQISYRDDGRFSVVQHYKKFNAIIEPNDDVLDFVNNLLKEINENFSGIGCSKDINNWIQV